MGQLVLLKNSEGNLAKIVLPHFPFCYLTFRPKGQDKVFQVSEFSSTGMQLFLPFGEIPLTEGQEVEGEVHWKGRKLLLKATVKWVKKPRCGLRFFFQGNFKESFEAFLDPKIVVEDLMLLTGKKMDLILPENLKYWLHADGPVDIFIWVHQNGEFSHFEILLYQDFLQWRDGVGVRTGRAFTQRNLDTPLFQEDEFVFKMDDSISQIRLENIKNLISHFRDDFLPGYVVTFLKLKLTY